MADDGGLDRDVTDAAVEGMVATLRPEWRVTSIRREAEGTDFVATLDVETTDAATRTVVLKATTTNLVPSVVARSEPRLLDLVDRETSVPVPSVLGFRDEHGEYPEPFYLLEHVEGENFEGQSDELPSAVRERVCRDAGRHLAQLHELDPLEAYGRIGIRNGELTVLDTDEHRSYDDFHESLVASYDNTLDDLLDGGYFPDLADDSERFADLVPAIREYVHETVPALPTPGDPRYCHHDYRYGNLLIDPETGETRAVLDWANLTATDPAYNLASVESVLLHPDSDRGDTASLRTVFRESYASERSDWSFDAETRERMSVYHLLCRLDAMACLPLWYEDATPAERDGRAEEHRAFVREYL
ncbi:phosphotransferase [Halobacteria archaeon HArc-gm2]|nr:phosphotransferase [Halobacteria archaeon HArc-gm2]